MISVKKLTYCSIFIAIAMILSQLKLFSLPQGGSVTACSSMFISLLGYWFGLPIGILSGTVFGLLRLISGPTIVHPAQFVLDYILAFAALGLSGLFRNVKSGLYLGYVSGMLGMLIVNTASGYIFFRSYAPEGMHPLFYSLSYNSSYIIPEMLMCLVIFNIPAIKNVIYRVNI